MSDPWGKNVKVEFEDGIAWVALNRPEKRNAMSPDLNAEMLATLDTLEGDQRCGVVVITGSGDAWSAGMDLKEYFRATDDVEQWKRIQVYRTAATW
ncbi:MAG TPA: enoyl-CoA hydratase-related protein, partial [Stellaceae bacterium]|nr:enoyl-CoA hydratase-related protein [Stellaceae bacterium]